MDRVGIITLGGHFNYGNRLQNYASDSVWRGVGYEPTSLYLADRFNLYRSLKGKVRAVFFGPVANPEDGMSEERLKAFDRFDQHMQRCSLANAEKDLVDSYRFFSVGSDQVWNPFFIAHNEEWFFLTFAKREQRIALSPSIGLDSLSHQHKKIVARGVQGFPRLSVREQRGAELIKECSGIDAEVICDPTLVLSAEEWRAVSDGRCTPSGPYIFTYLLGGIGSEASAVLEKVTDHGRIPMVPLTDRQKPGEPDAGPAEFIDLIDNATHVVTDSFHAAVFSSILKTPLTIVHREGGASMFSRLEQLSGMLGIEEKVYGSPGYDLSRAGDYEGVYEAIARERAHFIDYLKGCLNG